MFSITSAFLNFALFGAEWVLYLLIMCSILNFTIIIERILFFYKISGNIAIFVEQLTDKLCANKSVSEIITWCDKSKMLEANIAKAGLNKSTLGIKAIEDAMNVTIISSKMRLDKGLTILGTLGSNTPFIGLFGTVIGIIQAFHALSINKSAGPEVVMSSISEALVATAIGLLVAIPAVIFYNIFLRTIKKKMANSEIVAKIILTHFDSENVLKNNK